MINWEITYEDKTYTLYFDEETHTYFLEGEDIDFEPIISTTQVIHMIFPKKYDGISPEVLKKAAERGTSIHNAISDYELGLSEIDLSVEELKNYIFIKRYYCMECLETEKPILLKIGNTWIAGRFDLVCSVKNLDTDKKEISLIDIKTTSTLDIEYLEWQLNIYRVGYEKCNKRKIKSLYGLHLRKKQRRLQAIPLMDDENVIKKLKEILKENE